MTVATDAQTFSDALDANGPQSTGASYATRRQLFTDWFSLAGYVGASGTYIHTWPNALNGGLYDQYNYCAPLALPLLSAPPPWAPTPPRDTTNHGAFFTNLHNIRWRKTVQYLQTEVSPQTKLLELIKMYSSGWIIKAGSTRIAIDLTSPTTLDPAIVNCGHVNLSTNDIDDMVAELDGLIVTHIDRDHFNEALYIAMVLAGKPVWGPIQVANQAFCTAWLVGAIIVDPTSTSVASLLCPSVTAGAQLPNAITFVNWMAAVRATPGPIGSVFNETVGSIMIDLVRGEENGTPPDENDCVVLNANLGEGPYDATILHMGDNSNQGAIATLRTMEPNWNESFGLYYGGLVNDCRALLNRTLNTRFMSHDLEINHPDPGTFQFLNPSPTVPHMQLSGSVYGSGSVTDQRILFWGEMFTRNA